MSTPQGRHGGARHVTALTMNPALDLTVRADGWQRGEVNAGQSLQQDAGGKGVNVASILADWNRADWNRSAPDRAGQGARSASPRPACWAATTPRPSRPCSARRASPTPSFASVARPAWA
ncbi:hypothetical protein [Deinococcus aquaticus]|uniref:hypothetical protein n=1 Tax=Deinococcus aquaticus TaxID=328692 RepID=UPI00361C4159